MLIDKPIRLIELFAGIGAQAKALENLGVPFEHYRICEYDKYAIKSYNAIHGTNFDTSDIREIHASDLGIVDTDSYCYILTYSFPCLTGDSLVLTNNGYKKIENISFGDMVLTAENEYKSVIASRKTGEHKTYRIVGQGIDEIRCTGNHEFFAREMTRECSKQKYGDKQMHRIFGAPKWKRADALGKSDYIGVAINKNAIVPKWDGIDYEWRDGRKARHKNNISALVENADFWWLIGRYVGDGWIRTQGGIIICCDKKETNEITSVADRIGFHYSIVSEKTVYKIHFPDKELEKFVLPFGRGAGNKSVPGFVIDLPLHLAKSFLDGYVSADGSYTQGLFKTSSVSRELSYGISQLVAKVYKTPYRYYKTERKPTSMIQGRIISQRPAYQVVWKVKKCKQDKAFYEDGYIWFPITSVSETGLIEPVYDIEVCESHSFTANGVIVHNCTDLSKAGKQLGMSRGSGTRSGFLWEVERLLKEADELPQILLMENVPDVVSDKFIGDFSEWIAFLDSLGYRSKYEILNAKNYGIPQNRKRCFMVSWLGDYYYDFPEPIPLKHRLKDVLEPTVDEKYYLSDEQVQSIIHSSYHQTADSLIDLTAERERESSADTLRERLQGAEVCKAIRTGGRGSLDRHSWDIVVENRGC